MPLVELAKNFSYPSSEIAGRKALLRCLVSGKRAETAAAIALLMEAGEARTPRRNCSIGKRSRKRHFFRARFYHGAKIRISAVLPPLVNLVGECLPQTLLMRPVGRERRSTLEEKIQHAPPLPCGQNPHDRGRIRRLYRAAETL